MNQKLEQFMSSVFEVMYGNHTIERAAGLILEQLSDFAQADVSYLIELSGDGRLIEHSFERVRPDICMGLARLEGEPWDPVTVNGDQGEEIITEINSLPQIMRPVFVKAGVRRLLQYPVQYRGRPTGYIGIGEVVGEGEGWQENSAVRSALNYLSRVLSVFHYQSIQEERMMQDEIQLKTPPKQSELNAETANEILDQISTGVVILKMPSYDKLLPVYGNLGQYRMLGIERTAVNASVPNAEEARLESCYFGDAFAGVHPEDMERVRCAYKAGYETDYFTVKGYRLLRGDGTYVWVNADLRLQESTPEYKLFYATYIDITEEHELQMKLSEALERQKAVSSELEKASNAKTDFLSRMSHDIRTPMNAILGLARLAKNELEHPDTAKNYLDKLESSGQFLMGLLNDVLDISKIEKNAIDLHPEPYELEEFRQQVEALVLPQCRQKDITFSFIREGVRYDTLMLDKLRFNQIVFNLLNNAVRYTPCGGRIELLLRNLEQTADQLHMQMVIRDNGIGMGIEFQEYMYEPFAREGRKPADLDGRSSGLGLAIVRSLVELMGGTIQVKSAPGKGTEFTLDFWRDLAPNAVCPQAPEENTDLLLSGVHVLLCEDNELNMEIAVYLLEAAGAMVDCAGDGREAVEKFRNSEPGSYDVILMDIRMPVMGGLEAARTIRGMKRQDASAVPIFAMTANAYEEDKRMSREAGMNEHLSKPIDTGLLYRTIRSYTGRDNRVSGEGEE